MKLIYFLFSISLAFLFLISMVNAGNQYSDCEIYGNCESASDLISAINYTQVNVNNSIYWGGNAWSDTRWLNIDGSNANTNIDIGTYELSSGGLFPESTLTYNIGSGALRWLNLFVGDISADYMDVTNLDVANNLTVLGNLTADLFIGDGSQLENLNVTGIMNVSGDFTGYEINISFLAGAGGIGRIDLRGDPWYLTGTDLQIADDLIVDGNISSSWFNGLFDWVTGDTWNSFNGSTLLFNESKLSSTYYNATTSQLIAGILDGGSLDDTKHSDADYDSVTMNFSEASGSPGLDVRVNFTVESFNRIVFRYKTSNLIGDYPVRQLWSYDTNSWEDYTSVAETLSFSVVTQPVFDNAEHVQDDIVQMRLYKSSNGNTNNHYYIDWVAIIKGYGTPSGVEIDPYSFHKDENINMTNNNITNINYLKLTNTTTTWNMYVDVNGTLVWEQE